MHRLYRTRVLRATTFAATLILVGCAKDEPATSRLTVVERSDGPRRIDVLFIGHADTTHDANAAAALLAAAVGKDGINIHYAANASAVDSGTLALIDAVIAYAQPARVSLDSTAVLREFVESGRGFIAIHSLPESGTTAVAPVPTTLASGERARRAAGDPASTETRAQERTAPAAAAAPEGAPAATGTDAEERTDAAVPAAQNGISPDDFRAQGEARTIGQGRAWTTSLGHDLATWEQPDFQATLREAVLWSVGDVVRAQLEAYDVQPLVYVDPPVVIPNYENRPGPLRLQEPLSPEESVRQYQVPPGFDLELFAAEPDIVNPIAMTFDERGRLWVVETLDYPNDIRPDGEGNDVIRILEDTDGDGRADGSTVFADGLSIPTGIVLARGGAIISNAPRFLFLQDTTGDDRADVREEIMTGWSVADTHSGPSNLEYGFDNRIWGVVGDAGFDGEIDGRRLRFEDALYRFDPDGSNFEIVARFTNNMWAIGFSESFDVFTNTANNEHSVFVAIPNRFYEGVSGLRGTGKATLDGHYARHSIQRTRQVDYFGGFTAAGGHRLYTARSFPREYWNRIAFVHEAVGGLVHNAVLERDGSGFRESDGWNVVASTDEWAAPVHAQVGPDGALWILDWYSFIKQHNPTPPGYETGIGGAYETPLRDRNRGRIYRLVYRGAPPYEPLSLSRDRPRELIAALRHDNLFWRMTAQRLLVERGEADVLDDLYDIIGDRWVDETGLNGPAVNALWTLHGLGALDGSNARAARAVEDALTHPAAGVRKNAVMVLPRDEQTFARLERAGVLRDNDLNVRLHAFLALAEVPGSTNGAGPDVTASADASTTDASTTGAPATGAPATGARSSSTVARASSTAARSSSTVARASNTIGRALYTFGKDSVNLADQWLPTALYLAAARHAEGYLDAYAEEVGALEMARIAGRAARGELDAPIDWSGVDLDDADWDTIQVPAHWITTKLAHFLGVVWFRTTVDLSASAAGRAATLGLGAISDIDVAYVNGVRVGSMENLPGEVREYPVPAGLLRAGRNVVAVAVTNQRRGGGMYGSADQVFLAVGGSKVPLAGSWRYRGAEEWRGARPSDFSAAIPFAEQFMRYYDPAGGGGGATAVRSAAGPGGAGGVAASSPGQGGVVPASGIAADADTANVDVTVSLSTIVGQNRYDTERLEVRAGQRVALRFENTDGMLHNVVILQRGAVKDSVGAMLNAYVSDSGATGRDFVPPRLDVIAQSSMVSPRQAATLVFTAPSEPGEYPFVCTVPGHWVTMWGVLRVTGD